MKTVYFGAYLILIFLAGIAVLMFISPVPAGYPIFHMGIFAAGFIMLAKKRKWKILLAAVFAILTVIFFLIPFSMRRNMLIQELMLVSGLIYLNNKEPDVLSFLHIKKLPLLWLPFLMAETVFLIYISSFVNACSLIFFKNSTADYIKTVSSHVYPSVLIVCILPAITEEILFRGGILRGVDNTGVGILVSSLMFSAWHLNLNQMSYSFVMGLFFGFMVVITDNLLCSITVHFLFNLYGVLNGSSSVPVIGKLISFMNKGRRMLFPALLSENRTIIWHHFIRGLMGAFIAAGLCLFILIIMKMTTKDVSTELVPPNHSE